VARTGDEPTHARSALGLRLALTIGGFVCWSVAAVIMFEARFTGVGVAFAVIAVLSLLNAVFVVHRMHQGPHWQPGRAVPPYRPLPEERPSRQHEPRPPVAERTRATRYLVLMGICLLLIVLAWTVVRLYSVTAAVVMSVVAMVIPPIAAIVANQGWDRDGR
jgi:hypothetical protein